MKIVILDGHTENPGDLSWAEFEALGEVTVYPRTVARQEDLNQLIVQRSKGAKAVLVNKTPLHAQVLEQLAPDLKYIGVLATGYNVVDVEAARRLGITVSNVPTYGTAAVAQFTMALLLEVCHHIGVHSDSVKAGEWSSSPDFCYWKHPLVELDGKTMGIVGYGRIGRTTAKLAAAFGMKVLAYDEYPFQPDGVAQRVTLDDLFEKSDVVSLHCPLFPSTQGMINNKTIAMMKDGVFILNTSRGPLIVEQDLADRLNDGKVGAAALDVVSEEPISPNNPLLQAKNCMITPHIAWAPRESRQRLMDCAVDNLQAFLAGNPQNVVSG